jgi:Zn finger protein HypA/HybF involved in hydrogenase expression
MCPKCHSKNITVLKGNSDFEEMNIPCGIKNVKVERYVCCNCGYIEFWVADSEKLVKIEKKYSKITQKLIQKHAR